MKKIMILVICLLAISFIASISLYSQLPDQIASHWNQKNEVDSFMDKFWGTFLIPLLSAGMFILFLIIPRIDPLKNNLKKFMNYYERFILVMIGFFLYVQLLILSWNIGYKFDMGQMIIPAIGFLFIYIGFLVEKAKRNWFVGIRTPWTLSNVKVWERTHKLGGKLFKIIGIITLFGAFFPDYLTWFILIPVLGVTIFLFAYSYFEYQKETKKK